MNNIELVFVKSVPLPELLGVVTGLELKNATYYIILNRAVHKVEPNGGFQIAMYTRPLLKGILRKLREDAMFFCDGFYFYYQPEGQEYISILCPNRLTACAYSPTQDKIAYLDVDGNVGLCDINVETKNILEENIWSLDDPVPPAINVNWGTGETQFLGFDNVTQVDAIREAVGSECTDDTPEIIWRPDGKFFVVAYKQDGKRRFKTFSITSGVVGANEDLPGLHSPISWRSIHNMITVACCIDDKWRLMIFEPSGIAKVVIDLEEKGRIVQITWNDNGEILAIVQEGLSEWYLTLLTIGNYTFEIKQKLIFNSKIRFVQWHMSIQDMQHLAVIANNSVTHYFFRYDVTSSGVFINGASSATVIDNHHVAFLNFKTFVVPPPYKQLDFASILKFPNTVNRVVYNASRNTILCVDCRNICYVYDYASKEPAVITERCGFILPIEECFPLSAHHIAFIDETIIFYAVHEGCEKIIEYDLAMNSIVSVSNFRQELTGVKYIKTEFSLQLFTHFKNGDLCVNGQFYQNFISGIKKIDKITYDNMEYFFVLDNNGLFIANSRIIATNVTSFVLFSQYLLYTTSTHRLYSTRLDLFGDTFTSNKEPQFCFDCRMLEKEGTLVVGIPNKLVAILQLPRGNVEMVSTDLLGIDSVNSLLTLNLWEQALTEVKLRHLNLNILIDSNIDRFVRHIDKFLNAQSIGSLLEFIMSLNEHNMVRSMNCRYQYPHMVDTPGKIVRICSALLEEMEHLCLGQFIEAIMVARVKLEGLQTAIDYAQSVYVKHNLDVNKVVEKGLKAVCRYWNPEDVAAACLKTYDLDFSLFAHFSFKHDPQLTSMLIDNFSDSSSEYEKRFKINNYVGDYQAATSYYTMHILEIGPQEDGVLPLDPLINYARVHEELEIVYNFLHCHGVSEAKLCHQLAEYLEGVNRKSEAAQMYAEAGELEAALALYVNIFKWEEAVHTIDSMNLGPNERSERMEGLADHFDALGAYQGAKAIYLSVGNYGNAIDSCIHAHSFCEAIQLANEYQPTLRAYIGQHLNNYVTNVEQIISSSKIVIGNLTKRVETLWQNRMTAARAARAARAADCSECDTGNEYAESERTGVSSGRTFSSVASRNTRKEQRRYIDVKEGGQYEDIAIMRAIHIKITELYKMKQEVDELIFSLVDFNQQIRAKYLECGFCEMMEILRNSIGRIWFPGLSASPEDLGDKLDAARKNLEFMEEKYRYPPVVGEKRLLR